MGEEEEFELIPMTPLRRLEKRLEKMESTKGIDVKTFFSQLVEIVKMNQQLVDELAKADDALRIEIARLPAKLDELIDSMGEIISFIKASATGEVAEAAAADLEPLLKKMDALIELNKKIVESNETMMSTMDKLTKIRKTTRLPPMRRGPPLPPMLPSRKPTE